MADQNFSNHTKFHPPFHFFLIPMLLFSFIGSIVNLNKSMGTDHLYSAALLVTVSLGALMASFLARIYALKAQDRVIRLEENLRHQQLAGKPLDSRLTVGQVIALRFASDGEMVALADKAAKEGTEPKAIKQSIKNWRADNCRL